MLSAVVFTPPALPTARRAGALLRTLSALVPAAVEGIVRDVALMQVGPDPELGSVADEAGCRVAGGADFAAALARAAAEARAPWMLVLGAGAAPTRLFGEEVARLLDDDAEGARGGLALREAARGGLGRWVPALAPTAGVVLPRARLQGGGLAGFAAVLRRARPLRALPTPAPVYR